MGIILTRHVGSDAGGFQTSLDTFCRIPYPIAAAKLHAGPVNLRPVVSANAGAASTTIRPVCPSPAANACCHAKVFRGEPVALAEHKICLGIGVFCKDQSANLLSS